MEFNKYRLKELAKYKNERINTNQLTTSNYISTENLLPNKQGKQKANKLPSSKTVKKYTETDILISNIRPYFKKIWQADNIGGISNDVLNITSSNEKISNDYLYYYLSQDKFFQYMTQTSKGTKMPRGDKEAIMEFEIQVPKNVKYQNFISNLGKFLDNKIEINNKIIANLEELSQTLFKHWFVDFEFPDEDGNPYKSSGGEMIDSELGKIPKGWIVKSLDEIANYINGLAMQKYPANKEESLPIVKIKELKNGFTDDNSNRCTTEIPEKAKIDNGDIIFSWSATLLVKMWTGGKAGLNQHLFKVTSETFPKWFYYLWTKRYIEYFINIANDKATTMGHINRKHLSHAKVVLPTQLQLENFDKIFHNLLDKQLNTEEELKRLIDLRDTLLPKLMSGELEIPDDIEVNTDELSI
ncbi:restriction endonuclease subunit S [Staphylococcus haemolyticus]|uniref:restriction endonuclease subunit S n=1 Tax=Staphylococcus haemolyticus TaxID=1283 RepID=UPI0034D6D14F